MPPARGNRHPGRTPAKAGRAGIQKPLNGWIPAFEGVRKLTICWINALRPSRQLPCPEEPPQAASRRGSFLRMSIFLNPIRRFPHAEERSKSASRSMRNRHAANFLPPAFAGMTE